MTLKDLASLPTIERSDTLTERVCSELRKALIDGVFPPGGLIKIRDVARALGVSPTPAREALNILIAEGALLADTNKSAMVPDVTRASLHEITELRVSLECVAAAAALPNMSKADIAEAAMHHDELVKATERGDINAILERNADFHFAIYRHAGMPLLMKMIETVWLRSGAYLRIAYPAYGAQRKGLTNHDQIIKCLKSKNADGLREAIERDIRDSSGHLFESLKRHFVENGIT